jgi:hypothetical protein
MFALVDGCRQPCDRRKAVRSRLLLLGLAVCVAALASAFAPTRNPSTSTARDVRQLQQCGVERWTVKTLQDRPKLLPVRDTTVAFLTSRPAPSSLPASRLPFERHVYRVPAAVTLVRPEDDGDFHLVLEDAAGRTMIAESPSASCTTRATSVRRSQMREARTHVSVCSRAVVTGVAFFDFNHGQTGVAPNAVELHPVLAFRCLSA